MRIGKACGEWDVEKLAEQIPQSMVREWNEYLDWELMQYAQAFTSMMPTLGRMTRSESGTSMTLTNKKNAGWRVKE